MGFITKLGLSKNFEIPGNILAGEYSGLAFLLEGLNSGGLELDTVAVFGAGLATNGGGLVAETVAGCLATLAVAAGAEDRRVFGRTVGGRAVEVLGLFTGGADDNGLDLSKAGLPEFKTDFTGFMTGFLDFANGTTDFAEFDNGLVGGAVTLVDTF